MSDKLYTTIITLIILGLIAIFGLKEMNTAMGFIMSGGLGCLAFLNIDKIKKFKVAGVEAEMKHVVDEANATILQLREVATTSAQVTLTTLMADSFSSGMTLEKRLDLYDQLIGNLNSIDIKEKQLNSAKEMWNSGIGVIFHRGIRTAIGLRKHPDRVNFDAEPHILKASDEFQELLDFSNWKAPSPEEMKRFIEEKNAMNPKVEELLKDYKEFVENETFRRRDIFVNL